MTLRAELRLQAGMLREMRESFQLSKTALARRTKTPRTNLVRWESGKSDIPACELKRLMWFYQRLARQRDAARAQQPVRSVAKMGVRLRAGVSA